ncbi:hydantoinase B/oxoprolinase family protein [Falsirhodobacter halotolerans]|uniref:hydantoinase B/oxoprolinase family protein n=1 Tax=Falsirhodobacter halotolerans TaxID=1146892 RepID=UPI001FD61474|nr:hydantoinase B/oxoprolinase family protein [Falsirhodobacter halotolerans]MCJ8138278.1 hydantoinase B/oxoprolinase family protein [Falsirhodobacter halotolerans]
MTQLSTVTLQVLWNRLISIVEEQAQALVRTAFSTSVREAGDLSAGVYNRAGLMLAQAVTGTPGHVNAMADAVAHFIDAIGADRIAPGDIYITNDPWKGTGHLHDITVVTPVFHDEAHIGFFACTAHVVDIGGRVFGADANSVYEEGLYIPITRFADAGRINDTLLQIVRANVREPDQVVGDIYALATCNDVGVTRLRDTLQEFRLSDLDEIAEFIFGNSRSATLERIAALTPGSAAGEMRIDGFAQPIDLVCRLHILSDRIKVDFAGTSGVDAKGINVPLVYTKAYACYALKCAVAPEIPNNAASLAPFEITAPEHSIVNASFPAPVALRHVIGHMIPDTVYNALDKLLPQVVPAEGASALCNFQLSLRPASEAARQNGARRAEILMFNSGGAGARPTLDGMSTTSFPSGVMTMPVEATEQSGPVVIWRKELRPDSGGAGTYRGGLGQVIELSAAAGHVFDISLMLDRVKHPARGRAGGGDGASTCVTLADGTVLQGKGRQFVGAGQKLKMELPGGAGYGPVAERAAQAVQQDLRLGYISEAAARDNYGLAEDQIRWAQDTEES